MELDGHSGAILEVAWEALPSPPSLSVSVSVTASLGLCSSWKE